MNSSCFFMYVFLPNAIMKMGCPRLEFNPAALLPSTTRLSGVTGVNGMSKKNKQSSMEVAALCTCERVSMCVWACVRACVCAGRCVRVCVRVCIANHHDTCGHVLVYRL